MGQVDGRIEKALAIAMHDTDWFVRLAAACVLNRVLTFRGEVAQLLLDALATSDLTIRIMALTAIERMEQVNSIVKKQVIFALHDSDWLTRLAAVRALRKVGHPTSEQIRILLRLRFPLNWYFRLIVPFIMFVQKGRANLAGTIAEMRDLNAQQWFTYSLSMQRFAQERLSGLTRFKAAAVIKDPIRIEIIKTLGEAEIENEKQFYQLLIVLNRYLHYIDQDVRQAAHESIRSLLKGRSLPGNSWVPLRQRMERRRRLFAVLYWLVLVVGVVMVAWALAYLDQESLLMRVLVILGGLIGIGAGAAQIVGGAPRHPWAREGE